MIEDVAQDGGFILSTALVVDDTNPEKLHALIGAEKTHGVYCALGWLLMSVFWVAAIIRVDLLLTRPGPKITGLIA